MAEAAAGSITQPTDSTTELLELELNSHRPLLRLPRDQMFDLFDKNGDWVISMEEVRAVLEELGAGEEGGDGVGADARELMTLLDSNTDGSISVSEFADFRQQVGMQSLPPLPLVMPGV